LEKIRTVNRAMSLITGIFRKEGKSTDGKGIWEGGGEEGSGRREGDKSVKGLEGANSGGKRVYEVKTSPIGEQTGVEMETYVQMRKDSAGRRVETHETGLAGV